MYLEKEKKTSEFKYFLKVVRTVQRTILASGHSAIIDKTDFFNDFFLLRSIIGISNTVARLILGILSQRMNRYVTRMNRIDQIVFVLNT